MWHISKTLFYRTPHFVLQRLYFLIWGLLPSASNYCGYEAHCKICQFAVDWSINFTISIVVVEIDISKLILNACSLSSTPLQHNSDPHCYFALVVVVVVVEYIVDVLLLLYAMQPIIFTECFVLSNLGWKLHCQLRTRCVSYPTGWLHLLSAVITSGIWEDNSGYLASKIHLTHSLHTCMEQQ